MHEVMEEQDTPLKELVPTPRLGLGSRVQRLPFQLSIRVLVLDEPDPVEPTALQDEVEKQDIAFSSESEPSLGLMPITQAATVA